ncbi:hypothetical protein F2Q68_00016004 [Brassica cretica]|uniref:Uncharacterized protein n=1 Tax=Brassica cretica TaxID=69181 RepID=A0A8S9HVK7_BRACR|nr:hypothetical protein F2Q68_00016004 [Brassica cretica]
MKIWWRGFSLGPPVRFAKIKPEPGKVIDLVATGRRRRQRSTTSKPLLSDTEQASIHFQSKEHKSDTVEVLDFGSAHVLFDELIQRVPNCIVSPPSSSVTTAMAPGQVVSLASLFHSNKASIKSKEMLHAMIRLRSRSSLRSVSQFLANLCLNDQSNTVLLTTFKQTAVKSDPDDVEMLRSSTSSLYTAGVTKSCQWSHSGHKHHTENFKLTVHCEMNRFSIFSALLRDAAFKMLRAASESSRSSYYSLHMEGSGKLELRWESNITICLVIIALRRDHYSKLCLFLATRSPTPALSLPYDKIIVFQEAQLSLSQRQAAATIMSSCFKGQHSATSLPEPVQAEQAKTFLNVITT